MKKYKKTLIICLFILLFPKIVFGAKSYLTGPETDNMMGTVYDEETGKGDSICTQTGTGVNNPAYTVTESGGKCAESGHVRSGSSNLCCPSGFDLIEGVCKKESTDWDTVSPNSNGTCPSDYGGPYPDGKCKKPVPKTEEADPSKYLYKYTVVIHTVGQQNCGSATISCSGTEGSVSYSLNTAYYAWAGPFSCRGKDGYCWFTSKPLDKAALSYKKGSIAYEDCDDPDGIVRCRTYYNRGCGHYASTPLPGGEPPSISGCWRRKTSDPNYNTIYGEEDYYEYKWSHVGYCGSKRCNTTLPSPWQSWELYKLAGEDGMNEELCDKKKKQICQPTTPSELNELKQANYCSQKGLNVPLDEKTKCETSSGAFYQIDCLENANIDYLSYNFEKVLVDNNYIDEKVAVVQPGNGFKYNVNIKHSRTCEGWFKPEKFNDVFDNTVDILKRADIYGDAQEYAWYYAILDAINMISKTYEEQYKDIVEHKKYLFSYDGTISFNYFWGKGSASNPPPSFTKSTVFVQNEDEEKVFLNDNDPKFSETYSVRSGLPEFDSKHNIVPGTVYNRNIYKFKYTLNQESLLEPKRVYIDRDTAQETENSNGIDGGKKVYTEEKTNITEGENYKITSVVNVYKKSEPTKAIAVITNEKCELKVYKDNVIYRIIEPTNPFVNSSRTIPKNWSGNIGDFTKTINPNIGTTLIK